MQKGSNDAGNMPDGLRKTESSKNELLTEVLDEHNLMRKPIPSGPDSLMMAVSDALYFTPFHHTEIQQLCIKRLNQLISEDKLIPRLSMFKGNSILYKDYTGNPNIPGFIKINLELVALIYSVRIMVYNISDDNYLNASIINYKNQHTIEIIRTHGNHFDSIHPKRIIELAGFCQNIVLNVIERSSSKQPEKHQWINFNNNNYITSQQEVNNDKDRRNSRRMSSHRRSLSDSYNTNTENVEENLRIYTMFMNSGPADEFLHIFKTRDHLPSEDVVIKPTLKMIEDDANGNDLTISNYPVSKISSGSDTPVGFESQGKASTFFQQSYVPKTKTPELKNNYDLLEIGKTNSDNANFNFKKQNSQSSNSFNPLQFFNQSNSQVYYPNPGRYDQAVVTSGKLPQNQGFRAEDTIDPLQKLGIITPSNSMRVSQVAYSPDGYDLMGNIRTSPYKQGSMQPFGSNQFNYDPYLMSQGIRQSPDNMPKRKPIILDEGQQRYTGTLKFFDEFKNYGFIVMDDDGSDIFVHYDDLAKAKIGKEMLKTAKLGNIIRLTFGCMQYIGRYNKSRKAIDVELLIQ